MPLVSDHGVEPMNTIVRKWGPPNTAENGGGTKGRIEARAAALRWLSAG
jgi:hypothetical protein